MSTSAVVELAAKDLNHQGGVFCPSPKADMKLWNTHPKVYLDVARTGEAKCPYCGTLYRLKAGEVVEFDTHVPHWFGNPGPEPAEVLTLYGPQGERIHVRARPAGN